MRYWMKIVLIVLIITGCKNVKIGLPTVPNTGLGNVGKEVYVQLLPVWDAEFGVVMNQPSDIILGLDNLIYVCDTGNNRIIMLDILGAVQGVSQPVENPLAITQDNLLNLLIVNGTNKVYKIDLVSHNHRIGQAPVEVVHEYSQNSSLVYRGITAYFYEGRHRAYAAAVDADDSTYGDIIDFEFFEKNAVENQLIRRGPLPLFREGQGLFVVKQPTTVQSQRYGRLDFLFGHVGENNFKVQGVAAFGSGQELTLGPNTAYINNDLYTVGGFLHPIDIEVDNSGFIFVLDQRSDTGHPYNVYRYNPAGKLLQSFGGEELFGNDSDLKPLNNPSGIAVTLGGVDPTVYICDSGNNRILLFRLNTELD